MFCHGLVEVVDLIFRKVTKYENHIGILRSKSFVPIWYVVFVVMIGAKGSSRNTCFNEGLFITAVLTIMLRC